MKGNKKNPMNIVLTSFEKCMLTLNGEMSTKFLMLVLPVSVCMQLSVDMRSFYVHIYD